jgi:hypothetical protein
VRQQLAAAKDSSAALAAAKEAAEAAAAQMRQQLEAAQQQLGSTKQQAEDIAAYKGKLEKALAELEAERRSGEALKQEVRLSERLQAGGGAGWLAGRLGNSGGQAVLQQPSVHALAPECGKLCVTCIVFSICAHTYTHSASARWHPCRCAGLQRGARRRHRGAAGGGGAGPAGQGGGGAGQAEGGGGGAAGRAGQGEGGAGRGGGQAGRGGGQGERLTAASLLRAGMASTEAIDRSACGHVALLGGCEACVWCDACSA